MLCQKSLRRLANGGIFISYDIFCKPLRSLSPFGDRHSEDSFGSPFGESDMRDEAILICTHTDDEADMLSDISSDLTPSRALPIQKIRCSWRVRGGYIVGKHWVSFIE